MDLLPKDGRERAAVLRERATQAVYDQERDLLLDAAAEAEGTSLNGAASFRATGGERDDVQDAR